MFLWLLSVALPLGLLLDSLLPDTVVRGQSLGILVPLAGTAASLLLWIPYSESPKRDRNSIAPLALMLGLWAVQLLLVRLDDTSFAYSTYCVPIILVMLLAKPPSRRDAEIAIVILALAIASVSLISLILGYLSIGPDAFQSAGTRIPLLDSVFDVEGRWFGPFRSENLAGPAGALVLTTGLLLKTRSRWVLVAAGLLVLFLSQARNAVLAALIAGTYLILTSAKVRSSVHRRMIQLSISASIAIAVSGYIAFRDPTMNGRTLIWQDFFDLWVSNPFFGVGNSGIRDYLTADSHHAVVALTHAHSVPIDILARYGVLSFVGSLGALFLVAKLCLSASRRGNRAGMTLFILLFVGSLGETLFSWLYLDIQLFMLILLVAISNCSSMTTPRTPLDAVLR